LLPPVIECAFVDFAVNESVTAIQGEVQCGIANRLTITHAMDENGAWGDPTEASHENCCTDGQAVGF
ncbi:MAG: hypothetical protein ACJ8F0_05460, partial [Xanthobacteraceae bacterium]